MAEETLQQEDIQQETSAGPGPGDKVGKLYKTLSGRFSLGDESEFRKNMQDSGKRDKLYSAVSSSFNLGSQDQFNSLFSAGAAPKADSKSEDSGASKIQLPKRPDEMPASDATRTQFTASPSGADVKSGGLHTYEAHIAQQNRDSEARLATAKSKMKAKGIPETPKNIDSTLSTVNRDIEQGNLSMTQDKDGNPIYGRNGTFLEGLETGLKEGLVSMASAAPLIWYGYINKDPKKVREALENERGVQDAIRNNPQGLLSGLGAPYMAPDINVSGEPVAYNGVGAGAGRMIGNMAPMVASTALIPEAKVAEGAVRAVSISPELLTSINPLLAKTAIAGTESLAGNITRITQSLYDEHTAANLEKGMSEEEAKDKAADQAIKDAPLQAFIHSVPDALMFGGAAGGMSAEVAEKASAATKFMNTVEHAAKRTVGFGAVGGTLEAANQLARKIQGYKTGDVGGDVSNAALAWMGQSAAFELLPVLNQLPKYLQSEVKDYAINNVSKPVLDKVLQSIPNSAEITSQLEKWTETTAPLKAIIPSEKMASVGGVTDKIGNIKKEISDLELQRTKDVAGAELSKNNLPEALHGSIDEHIKDINKDADAQIGDRQSQVEVANKQIGEMLKSDNPIAHEYDDMTGEPVLPKSNVSVKLPGGEKTSGVGAKDIEAEVPTNGTKVTLPETNKVPERVELKKQENVKTEKTAQQPVSEQPAAERVQPETVAESSKEAATAEPKKSGFSRLKERKVAESVEEVSEKEAPIMKRAAEIEDHTPDGAALSYFSNGGKISDSAIKEYFGDHQSEVNARLSIRGKNGAKTIDALAHDLWENAPEAAHNKYTTQDYREAIEGALGSHNSRSSMARELVERNTVGEEKVPEGSKHVKASEVPELFIEKPAEHELVDVDGNPIEGMPFQHKVGEVHPDMADMKAAVKEQIEKGNVKLSDIQKIAKEELGDVPEYANNPKKLSELVEDAYHEVGKENTPKEVTHGVVGAVSKWLDEKVGGKGKKIAVLSNSDSMFSKLAEFKNEPSLHLNEKGEILGFAHQGKIYLNAEHINPNTPIHEAGHIWTSWAKENNKDLYVRGMKLTEKSRYLKKVMANEFYKKEASRIGDEGSFKYNEYMKHEALAMAIGDKGAQFVTESQKNTFKRWLNKLWDRVSRVSGLEGVTPEKMGDLSFKDFTKGVAKDILSKGEKIGEKEVAVKESPVKESSKDLVGASHEALNKRAEELGLEPIARGKVLTPEEYADRGRKLIKEGVDPTNIFESDFPEHDKISVARAHAETLAKEWNRLPAAEQSGAEGLKLQKEFVAYDLKRKALGTEWARTGRSLQGVRHLETDDFLVLSSNMETALKRKMTPQERDSLLKMTREIERQKKVISGLEKNLIEAKDKEFSEGGGSEAPKGRKYTESAKKLANVFRKAKTKPFTFTDSNGNVIEVQKMGVGWNDIIEVGAKVIEKTGEIADGISAIVEHIKEEGFYKNLSLKDKDKFESELQSHFTGEAVRLTPEARSIRRLERQLKELQEGNIKAKGEPREISEKEQQLKDQIAAEKEKLGLGPKKAAPKDRAEAAIKRLEKQLDDLEAGVKKRYTDKGFEATAEQEAKITELKFNIQTRKAAIKAETALASLPVDSSPKTLGDSLIQLQDAFADKKGNNFSAQEAKLIWDYMKNAYLEKGVAYNDAVGNVSRDMGLTFEQVNHAIVTPKTKAISDEIWKKNADLSRGRLASQRFVEDGAGKGIINKLRKIQELPRAVAVFGHAGVFVGTHAKRALLNPRYTKMVAKAFLDGYKGAYTKHYGAMMDGLRADRNFLMAERAGLKNNPDQLFNLDSELTSEHYFGKVGSKLAWFNKSGERGFNAIKILRQKMFNLEFDALPEELKSDPEMVKKIAQMVNVSTGATNLKVPPRLNNLLFSAGLEANRWETLLKQPSDAIKVITNWKNSTPAERYALKMYSRNLGAVSGVLFGSLAMNNALNSYFYPGDDNKQVNFTNPTKSTWLRFNVGGHVSDMTGGTASTISFLSKLINIAVSDDKKNRRIESTIDTGGRYVRGKLAPFYGMVAEVLDRHDFSGNTVPWSDEKPKHGYNHQMGGWEYLVSHSLLPVAEASRGWFEAADKQGVDHDKMHSLLTGLLHFGMSGGLGITYYERGEEPKHSNRKKRVNRRRKRKAKGSN